MKKNPEPLHQVLFDELCCHRAIKIKLVITNAFIIIISTLRKYGQERQLWTENLQLRISYLKNDF